MRTLRVLIVEDNVDDAALLLRQLKKAEYDVVYKRAETAAEVRECLKEDWDIILSDYGMRDFNGLEALEILQESGRDIPFIIISGSIGEETAASLMRHGVNDYLMKDNLSRLAPAIQREMQEAENRREKREAEQALAESEERLKLALNAAGLGAWERDLITGDVFWSPETAAILGVTVGGARLDGLHWMIVEEDRDLVQKKYDQAIETRLPVTLRFRLRRRGGEIVWVSESARCEYDEHGKPLRLVGTIRDITRDKLAEDALIEAEERYRVMAETASDAVISIDEEGIILYANPATETIFGYKPADLTGKPLSVLMSDPVQEAHTNAFARYLKDGKGSGKLKRIETTGLKKDGSEIEIQISFGHYSKGGKHFFTGYIRDISDAKAAENALRESEENFRALVQATTKFVWQLDEKGNIVEGLDWWKELTGQEIDESPNNWIECVHPEDRERVETKYRTAIMTGEPMLVDLRVRDKNGTYRHYAASGVPVRDKSRTRWIGALTDITAQRVAEERYRLVSTVSTDYMFASTVDANGKLRMDWVAGAFEQITGYTLEDFEEHGGWDAIVHPDDFELERENLDALTENRPVESELRIINRKGDTVWVRVFAQPIWDSVENCLVGICGAVKDITEKKLADIAVTESAERFKTILNTEPECVKILAADATILDINPAGLRIVEADSVNQVKGLGPEGFLCAPYLDGFRDAIERVMAGESVEYTYEVEGFKGSRRWLEMNAVPLRDSSGEITSVLGVSRDITEKRIAEDLLIKSRAQYSELINSIEGIVWEADPETFRFTFVSRQAQTILGYPVEKWYDDSFWVEHIHGDDRKWAIDFCASSTHKGEPHTFEYRMIAADGRTVWLRDIVSVEVENGKPTALRGIMVDVTEQRRKDAALQRLAMLIDQTNEAIFTWDVETGIVEWNRGCEKLYGYTRGQALGKFGFDLLKSTLPFSPEGFIEHLMRKREWSGEITQTTRSGETVYVDARYHLIEFDGRTVVLETNRDRTGRRLAETALRRSEMRYRHLFENSPYPMFVYDKETLKFMAVNEAAVERYGYAVDEFLSMTILDIRPAEDVERTLERARSDLPKLDTSGTWRHKKKDGSIINVEVTSSALEWEGRPARLVLAHDISDRLRAEEALRQSEAKYRELFENANDIIYTHTLDGRFTSLNLTGERTLGYTEAEAKQLTLADVVAPEFLDRAEQMMRVKLEGSPPTIYETEVIAKDGRRVPIEINTRLIFEDGKPVGVQGIGRDISERVAAQAALRASEEQLRQSQKLESIGILAGGMAHDFNNMLTAINGYSDLILRKIDADDPIRKHVLEIRKAGERSADLARQLLAFSRRQILQPKVLNLNETIEETTSLLRRLIGEDIKIVNRLDPGLWKIEADPGQLAQVLMNLSINARDAMPGGGTLSIETSNITLDEQYASRHLDVKPGRYVALAVSDTGIGMDEETKRRVFEPFFTTKSVGRGTGLGLSTVYGIVKQSGGNIWVYSEPGHGSTFKIYLPEACTAESAVNFESSQRDFHIGSETILLVEDEASVRGLAREILEACGYEVIEAGDGVEALAKFQQLESGVDVLITDVVMPNMGGRELSEKLLKIDPKVKVLFTSGYTDDAILRHGISDEGTNFLQKPFTFDTLSRKVRSLLDFD